MLSNKLYLPALLAFFGTLTSGSALPKNVDYPNHIAPSSGDDRCYKYLGQYPAIFIDFFDHTTCSGIEMTDTPVRLNTTDCHKLTPASDNMAIGWVKGISSVAFFSDDGCKDKVKVVDQPSPLPPSCDSCVHIKADFGGKGAKSVKWIHE